MEVINEINGCYGKRITVFGDTETKEVIVLYSGLQIITDSVNGGIIKEYIYLHNDDTGDVFAVDLAYKIKIKNKKRA